MNISVIVPHYGTPKMTSYTIAQLIKYKGNHTMDIIVVNNKPGDNTEEYLWKVSSDIVVAHFPVDRYCQSQGVAIDHVIPIIRTEYFIPLESDAFPVRENWLDYYEKLIQDGTDMAGSYLQLSAGRYIHPCGSIYKKELWMEAKRYCEAIQYAYFPNMTMKEGHACHTMIHRSVIDRVFENVDDYIDLSESYKPFSKDSTTEKARFYSSVNGPFHNGMGSNDESIYTYGLRSMESDTRNILLDNKKKIIQRLAYEPGQWMSYFASAMQKKIKLIPIDIKWIEGYEGKQQEYSIMESGIKHIWAVSSYKTGDQNNPIAKIKNGIEDDLYNSLPANHRL